MDAEKRLTTNSALEELGCPHTEREHEALTLGLRILAEGEEVLDLLTRVKTDAVQNHGRLTPRSILDLQSSIKALANTASPTEGLSAYGVDEEIADLAAAIHEVEHPAIEPAHRINETMQHADYDRALAADVWQQLEGRGIRLAIARPTEGLRGTDGLAELLTTIERLRAEMRPHDSRAVMTLGNALDEAIALARAALAQSSTDTEERGV